MSAREARASVEGRSPLKKMLAVGRRFTWAELSAEDEVAYDLAGAQRYSRSTAVGLGLLVALIVIHAALAYAFHPAGLPEVAEMSEVWLVLGGVVLLSLLFQRLPAATVARGLNAFGVTCMILAAWIVVTASMRAELERQRFAYGTVEVFLIVVYMLFRMRPVYSGFAGLSITALYLFTAKAQAVYAGQGLGQVAAYLGAMNAVGLIVSVLVERQERQIFLTLREIEREQARAEGIIRNILPVSISDKLKGEGDDAGDAGDAGDVVAEAHPEVTVLHADLVGFTALAAALPPASLVAALDELFSQFDRIMARHDVEKLKTEGDAYIAAAGVPLPMHHHALRAAAAALAMVEAARAFAAARGIALNVRIGLDTGSVVAGVIGKQKPIYDLWGAPVSGAARIEPYAEAGTVLASAATAERLEGYLQLAPGPALKLESGRTVRTFVVLADPPG